MGREDGHHDAANVSANMGGGPGRVIAASSQRQAGKKYCESWQAFDHCDLLSHQRGRLRLYRGRCRQEKGGPQRSRLLILKMLLRTMRAKADLRGSPVCGPAAFPA